MPFLVQTICKKTKNALIGLASEFIRLHSNCVTNFRKTICKCYEGSDVMSIDILAECSKHLIQMPLVWRGGVFNKNDTH